VHRADGGERSRPDTQANQKKYPQRKNQQPGLGFPRRRLVVLLALATACRTDAAGGPCKGKGASETERFRALVDRLGAGDVVVADRSSCTGWLVARRQRRGADACFRLHPRRPYDFAKGRPLGPGDHVVRWVKPARPPWRDAPT